MLRNIFTTNIDIFHNLVHDSTNAGTETQTLVKKGWKGFLFTVYIFSFSGQ